MLISQHVEVILILPCLVIMLLYIQICSILFLVFSLIFVNVYITYLLTLFQFHYFFCITASSYLGLFNYSGFKGFLCFLLFVLEICCAYIINSQSL